MGQSGIRIEKKKQRVSDGVGSTFLEEGLSKKAGNPAALAASAVLGPAPSEGPRGGLTQSVDTSSLAFPVSCDPCL